MKKMNDEDFVARVKSLADVSDMDIRDKKRYSLFVAYACDTEKHEHLINEYLQKDGITFQSLIDYVCSILPPVEIVDDETELRFCSLLQTLIFHIKAFSTIIRRDNTQAVYASDSGTVVSIKISETMLNLSHKKLEFLKKKFSVTEADINNMDTDRWTELREKCFEIEGAEAMNIPFDTCVLPNRDEIAASIVNVTYKALFSSLHQ